MRFMKLSVLNATDYGKNMRIEIRNTMKNITLSTLLLIAPQSLAQECLVMVSRPEIQLGTRPHIVDSRELFLQQILTVTATCNGEGDVGIVIKGMQDESGKNFRFGEKGLMELKLISANLNGANTTLTIISTELDERQFIAGQSERLSADDILKLPESTGVGSRHLKLNMQLNFPSPNYEERAVDKTEMNGQLRFETVHK